MNLVPFHFVRFMIKVDGPKSVILSTATITTITKEKRKEKKRKEKAKEGGKTGLFCFLVS